MEATAQDRHQQTESTGAPALHLQEMGWAAEMFCQTKGTAAPLPCLSQRKMLPFLTRKYSADFQVPSQGPGLEQMIGQTSAKRYL